MTYKQYFIIGLTVTVGVALLLVLIFMNTLRMYAEKKESEEDRTINSIDIQVNEERIMNNTNTINGIKTDASSLKDNVIDMDNDFTSMMNAMGDDVTKNEESINSINNVLDSLKKEDKKLHKKDEKMNEDWMKQFNTLLTHQRETKEEILDQVDDRFMFVNVSEETSIRITDLEKTIEEAEKDLDYLRTELERVQYAQ
jgi:predicted RNase H-like nuclease (RuvC/YqgF family)